MSFDEVQHPRAVNGTFTTKELTEPEVSLTSFQDETFDLTGLLARWVPGEDASDDAHVNFAVDAFWNTPDVRLGTPEAEALNLELWVPGQDPESDAVVRDELLYRLELEPFTLSPHGRQTYGAPTDEVLWKRNTDASTGDGYAGTAVSKEDFDSHLDAAESRAFAWVQIHAENSGLLDGLSHQEDTPDEAELADHLLQSGAVNEDAILRAMNNAYQDGLTGDASTLLYPGFTPEQHIPDIVTRMVISKHTGGRFGAYDTMSDDDPAFDAKAALSEALADKRLTGGELIALLSDTGSAGAHTRIGLTPIFERIYT